jgi:hypothetical protein
MVLNISIFMSYPITVLPFQSNILKLVPVSSVEDVCDLILC